jgi:hypothetical protein
MTVEDPDRLGFGYSRTEQVQRCITAGPARVLCQVVVLIRPVPAWYPVLEGER